VEHSNGSADEKQWERPNAPLGTLIYRAGLLSKEKLEGALAEGARTGRRLGEVLMQKGWIDEKDLARLLAGQKALPFVSLRGRGFDEDVARLLPERICRYHTAMATGYEEGELLVAIADPGNDEAIADITSELDQTFRLVVAVPSEIFGALDQVFGNGMPAGSTNGAAVPAATASAGGLSDDFGLRIAVAEPSAPATPVPATPVPAAPAPAAPAPAAPAPAAPAPAAPAPAAPAPAAPPLERSPEAAEPAPVETAEPAPVEKAEPAPVEKAEPAPAPAAPPLERSPEAAEPAPAETAEPAPVEKAEPAPVETAAEEPSVPGIRIEHAPPPEPPDDPLSPPADDWEPKIERNEAAHVSVAFHAPATIEPADPPAVEAEEEPVSPGLPEPLPVAPEIVDIERFRIALEIEGEDEVDYLAFGTHEEAEESAREFIARLARREEWPLVGTRFIPPDRIRAIHIRERQSFTGSAGRARWAGS